MREASLPFLSIIVPTYQRAAQIQRLLPWFFAQKIDRQQSELIIVDDGSTDRTWDILEQAAQAQPWLKPLRQKNAGQAAARQRGVEASRGDILLFIDDDMEPASFDFFEQHRQFHAQHKGVALGAILPPPHEPSRPAFEYFYEKSIRRQYEDFTAGRLKPAGKHFFSANVSLPKSLFLSVGGFDASYRHAEDRELGLRLEHRAQANFSFLPAAAAYHHSPTGLYSSFIRRAELYGAYDLRMAQLYPDREDLHPQLVMKSPSPIKRRLAQMVWRWPSLPLLANPLLIRTAVALHRMGLTFLALPCCSVLYTINYVRGYRQSKEATTGREEGNSHAA